MENNTPSTKKFNNVILQLSQEMHYHVHRSKNPDLYSNKEKNVGYLAVISKESEELASEYADAIALLSKVEEEIQKLNAEQTIEEEILLLDSENVNNNPKNYEPCN
jgi:hypothetical protein